MLTAGLRCAPDTLPMNRMIANTIRPGATTAAVRLIVPGKAWPIIPPPAATSTRKKVPSSSENNRRHAMLRILELRHRTEQVVLERGCGPVRTRRIHPGAAGSPPYR